MKRETTAVQKTVGQTTATDPASTAPVTLLVQRKCACGGAAGAEGECEGCRRRRLGLQAKLRVNQPGDRYEEEADRVAGQIMGMATSETQQTEPPTSKRSMPHGHDQLLGVRRPLVQRRIGDLAQPASTAVVAPALVEHVLSTSGRPLDLATQQFMGARFGHDFSQVRVHTDARAAQSAQAVNAHAYTVGEKIVFGAGEYLPQTEHGRRLLAHELTHVVQQDKRGRYGTLSGARYQPSSPTLIQRDLARPPGGVPDPLIELTAEEIQEAITFNEGRFSDPYSLAVIRDVVGISRFPAVVDEELIQAIVAWQAERRMTQDGKIGHTTTRTIFLELVAEREFQDAVFLLIDSYALPISIHLRNIRVGTGMGCCRTATVAGADAVTSDVGGGNERQICVCLTSVPRNAAGYNHFVRILLHELVHVPQRAAGPADHNAREFDAFFAETCAGGRAPLLAPAERVGHARLAIAHFNAMGAAFQTAARIAMRDRLNRLIAAGGVGAC